MDDVETMSATPESRISRQWRWAPALLAVASLATVPFWVTSGQLARVLAGPMYHLAGRDGLETVASGLAIAVVGLVLAHYRAGLAIVVIPLLVGPLYPRALPLLLGDEPHYLTIAE